MKKEETYIYFVLFIILLISIISALDNSYDEINGFNINMFNMSEEVKQFNGYIIEFKDPSLVEKQKEIEQEINNIKQEKGKDFFSAQSLEYEISQKEKELSNYKENLKSEHKSALLDIENKLKPKEELPSLSFWQEIIIFFKNLPRSTGNSISEEETLKPENEFYNVFNGVSLNISDEEAENLRKVGYKVYPNLIVHANLMDSVPLIGADKIWESDADGNNCIETGKECLTGKNVTIAIIDTGVDYTHPDLGGGNFNEGIEQINAENWQDFPKIYGDKIVLLGGDQGWTYWSYFLYDLSTKEKIKIAGEGLGSISTSYAIYKNIVAYSYIDGTSPIPSSKNLYIYNILTGERTKITPDSYYDKWYGDDQPDIYEDKLVYVSMKNIKTNTSSYYEYYLYYYDISTGERTEIAGPYIWHPTGISLPKIYRDKIIYSVISRKNDAKQTTNITLYLYDLSTKERKIIHPTTTLISSYAYGQDIYENKIAYSISNEVYIYDISTGEKTKIKTGDSEIKNIVIDKDKLIWTHYWEVYVYDLITGKEKIISCQNSIQDCDMYNNKIICKKPVPIGSTSNPLYLYSLPAATDYCEKISLNVSFPNSKVVDGRDFTKCLAYDTFTGKCIGPKNETSDPMDNMGHGTHVAGIAAGTGKWGLKGVAPDAKIYAYKVLGSNGMGFEDWVLPGIERAVDPNKDGDFSDHVDIISMSLGGDCKKYFNEYNEYCGPDDPLSKAIDNAVDLGVVAVIAAGNSGPDSGTIGSPGTARKAITVGATDKSDVIASFSSRGPVFGEIVKPDIVAPGVSICSAQFDGWLDTDSCIDDKHIAISGTSMATPHVAGAAALIKQAYPNLNSEEIKQILIDNAKDIGYDSYTQGVGRLDLPKLFSNSIFLGLSKNQFNINERVNQKNYSLEININNLNLKNENYTFNIASSVNSGDINVAIYPNTLVTGKNLVEINFSSKIGDIKTGKYRGAITLIAIENPDVKLNSLFYLNVDYNSPFITNRINHYLLSQGTISQEVISVTDKLSNINFDYKKKGDLDFKKIYSNEKVRHLFEIVNETPGDYEYFINATSTAGLSFIDNNGGKNYELILPSKNISQTGFNKIAYFNKSFSIFSKPGFDLNNDGKTEFILRRTGKLDFYKSNGDNSFDNYYSLNFEANIYDYDDTDKDNLSELLLSPISDNSLRLYESSFSENFSNPNLIWKYSPSYSHVSNPKIDDLDNDGKKDIIFYQSAVRSNDGLYIYKNNGNNVYSNVSYVYYPKLRAMEICDLDNDGKKEIILGEYDYVQKKDAVVILKSNGDNSYSQIWNGLIIGGTGLDKEGGRMRAQIDDIKCLGDNDGNGKNEFLVVDELYNSVEGSLLEYRIFDSHLENSFDEMKSFLLRYSPSEFAGFTAVYYSPETVKLYDIDGDGLNETLLLLSPGDFYIFKNKGEKGIIPIWYHYLNVSKDKKFYFSYSGIGVDDYDGDGKAEVIFTGRPDNEEIQTYVYEIDINSICIDKDNDGFNSTGGVCGITDCNDNNSSINPRAIEICNGVDDNCDGQIDEGFLDLDLDNVKNCIDNCVNVHNPNQRDSDNDGLGDLCDKCPKRYGPILDTNNKNGCPPPKNWTKFMNNVSTNLSKLIKYDYVNLKLSIINKGIINFNENVSVGGIDLNKNVRIERNFVEINTSSSPELNVSAEITLFNVSNYLLRNIKILKEGSLCNECYITSYSNNTIVFNVSHFTRYSLGIETENSVTGKIIYEVVGNFCGDNNCDNDETCSSCPEDCGVCTHNNPPGSGGSSGGGGSGGGTPTPKTNTTNKSSTNLCLEKWVCDDYENCSNGKQTRSCLDSNNCGTNKNKPVTEIECEVPSNPAKDIINNDTTNISGIIIFIAFTIIIVVIIVFLSLKLKYSYKILKEEKKKLEGT